jgi:hypothetical protein
MTSISNELLQLLDSIVNDILSDWHIHNSLKLLSALVIKEHIIIIRETGSINNKFKSHIIKFCNIINDIQLTNYITSITNTIFIDDNQQFDYDDNNDNISTDAYGKVDDDLYNNAKLFFNKLDSNNDGYLTPIDIFDIVDINTNHPLAFSTDLSNTFIILFEHSNKIDFETFYNTFIQD